MSVVFVGNIPYDYTEEQLTDIFKQIGPVKNFRLVFDKDNGRGKGYGFCEYMDAGNAQSAVRNLDGYDVGNRQLRVAFSDSDQNKIKGVATIGTAMPATLPPPPPPSSVPPAFAQQFAGGRAGSLPPPPPLQQVPQNPNSAVPPLPPGSQPPSNLTTTDAISQTLSAMPPMQLLDVISHFKALVQTNPGQAENLLKQAPPLAYAVLQALLLMNLVDAKVLTKVISSGSVSQPPPAAAPIAPLQPPQQQYQQAPPTFRNSPTPVPQPQQLPPPPQQQQYRQSPAPPQLPQQAPAAIRQATPQRDPNTAALINQVMALTDMQINALPVEQQSQIHMIKQQVAAGLM